jgi:hypothetical protein
MAVEVIEIEATPAPAGVDLAVGTVVGPAAVGQALEDRLELRVADMESVVMALGF